MNITSPILAGAAHIAELPGDSVTALAEANDAFAIRDRVLWVSTRRLRLLDSNNFSNNPSNNLHCNPDRADKDGWNFINPSPTNI
jgi:hypothetical protein